MSTHPFAKDAPTLSRTALDEVKLQSESYWAELRIFLGVAKSKSINQAAKHLGVSKAKVSRQVQRLQDKLGAQLVTNTRSGTFLTAAGHELANLLVEFDTRLRHTADDLRGTASAVKGVVRVSITDGLGLLVLAPALPAFQARHPHLQVQIKTPTNMRRLRENQTDIMVGFAPETASDLTQVPLGTVHLIPFASRGYIERFGMPERHSIADHAFVNTERYDGQRGVWSAWNELVDRGRSAVFADAAVTYGMLVKLGCGIGLLPTFNLVEPRLVPLDLGIHVALPMQAISLTERLRARHVGIVLQFLSELLGPHNEVFRNDLAFDIDRSERVSGYRQVFNL